MKLDITDKPLSAFLEAADDTTKRVVSLQPIGFTLAQEVDEFIRLRLWGEDIKLAPLPATLALNSYYSFLGAVRIALSGQFAAVFPLIRHSLECACYCYLIVEKPEMAKIWLNRHKGPGERKACRKAFGCAVADVVDSVKSKQEDLANLIDDLYQASIDFGAHPNAKSILSHLGTSEVEEGTQVTLTCLYGEHSITLQQGLIACSENGIASAFLTALAARTHSLIDDQYSALAEIYGRVHEAISELQGYSTN